MRVQKIKMMVIGWLACCLIFPAYGEWVRAAATPNSPPLSTVDATGEPAGFSVELFRAALTAMGREVSLRSGPFTEIMADLEAGRLDALPAVIRTPERMERLDFSVPHLTMHGALFVRDDNPRIRSLDDLAGQRIAVMAGASSHEYVLRVRLSEHIIPVSTQSAAFRLLADGEADAVIAPREFGVEMLREQGLENIHVVGRPSEELHQDVCFAVRKGNAALLAVLNEGLARVTADGTRRQLASKWLGENRLEAAKARVLVYGGDQAYPPYEFLDRKGRPRGFNIDLLRAIAREIGIDVTFHLEPWSEALGRIERGEVDVGSMIYSPERAESLLFSTPHSELHMAGFARSDAPAYRGVSDLKGRRVAAVRGDLMHEYALSQGLVDELTMADRPEAAMDLLASGEVDFALMPRMQGYYCMRESNLRDLRASKESVLEAEYCFAAAPGQEALIQLLNDGLQRVKESGEYREIYNKWLGVLDPDTSRQQAIRYILSALGVIAVLCLLSGTIIMILRRQVQRRTAQLQKSNEKLERSRQRALGLMEEALQAKASLELAQYTIDFSTIGIFWVRPDSSFSYVNREASQMTGYTPEELQQLCVRDLDPEYDAERWAQAWALLERGEKVVLESRCRTKDGHVFPVEMVASHIEFGGEKIVCSFVQDVSERKQAELELRESREKLRITLNSIGDAVISTDTEGRVLMMNPVAETITGWPRAEAIGRPLEEVFRVVDEGTREPVESPVRQSIETGTICWLSGRALLMARDGREIAVADSAAPIRNSEDQIIGAVLVFSDQTRERAARAELNESRQLLRNILDTVPTRVWWKDRDSRLLGCNARFARDAGLEPEAMVGKADTEFSWTDQAGNYVADDQEVIASGQAKMGIQETLTTADGRLIWVETNKAPLLDGDGRTIGVVGCYTDVTERRRMREAIEKRILALTRPLGPEDEVAFDELFNLNEIQRIQDEFAAAVGVATVITAPDGSPVTRRSNYSRLCHELIAGSGSECRMCRHACEAYNESGHGEGRVEVCPSSGFLAAVVPIRLGGRQIASWLIGQVRDEVAGEEPVRARARELGLDEEEFVRAFFEVPVMSRAHFDQIIRVLTSLVEQLTTSAYQNVQQARFIAEREQAEAALKEREEMYRRLFHDHSAVKLLIDAETGMIVDANPSAEEFYGWSRAELLKMNINQINTLPDNEVAALRKTATEKHNNRFEFNHRRADGSVRDVSVFSAAIQSHGKTLLHSIIYDITESKKVEQERLRLARAIEQSPEAVVVTDLNGSIQYVNPAFSAISGYSREEVMGRTPRVLKSGKHDKAFYKDLWGTLRSGQTWEGHLINKRKNGALYTEKALIAPVKDSDGVMVGYVAVNRDISEELAQEELLRQSQKMEAVGQLAGGIAHDFNNLIQVISGFSQMLLAKLEPHSQDYENLQQVLQAAGRAAGLTRQLLAFSHKREVEITRIDLNQVVDESRVLFKVLLGENIESVVSEDPELKPVLADYGQLSQVIMNLAVNARDAMPEGGRLTITTENVQMARPADAASPGAPAVSGVRLSVSDTGCGMSAQVKAHLFDPFFTTKGVGKGTGLGLPVVYGIIKRFNGWIQVESEEGKGSVFSIYLPDAAAAEELAVASGVKHPVHKEQILLVCDDRKVRGKALSVLRTFDQETVVAETMEEACVLFGRSPDDFRLLICNIGLKGSQGIELADTLRVLSPELQVLLLADQADRQALSSIKEYTVIEVPFSVTRLISEVHRALNDERE